jgi:hypothetical protein
LNRDETHQDTFDYTDLFYNPTRMLSPVEFERRHQK